MERKAKFKRGQVVRTKDGSYGRLVTPKEARPLQWSESKKLFNDNGEVYVEGAKEFWYHKSEMRSLTKREKGES